MSSSETTSQRHPRSEQQDSCVSEHTRNTTSIDAASTPSHGYVASSRQPHTVTTGKTRRHLASSSCYTDSQCRRLSYVTSSDGDSVTSPSSDDVTGLLSQTGRGRGRRASPCMVLPVCCPVMTSPVCCQLVQTPPFLCVGQDCRVRCCPCPAPPPCCCRHVARGLDDVRCRSSTATGSSCRGVASSSVQCQCTDDTSTIQTCSCSCASSQTPTTCTDQRQSPSPTPGAYCAHSPTPTVDQSASTSQTAGSFTSPAEQSNKPPSVPATTGRTRQPRETTAPLSTSTTTATVSSDTTETLTTDVTTDRGQQTAAGVLPQSAGLPFQSAGELPSGDELGRLIDAIAGIEHDVRTMAAALQSTINSADRRSTKSSTLSVDEDTEKTAGRQTGGRPQYQAGGPGSVALLLPPTELSVTSSDPPASNHIVPTTQRQAAIGSSVDSDRPTSHKSQSAKDAKNHTPSSRARVVILPPPSTVEKTGKQTSAEYGRYALVPAAGSRLPFRLATGPRPVPADVVTTQTSVTQTDETDQRPADTSQTGSADESSSAAPQFINIHQIIRHLESISTASPPSTAARPLVSSVAGKQRKYQQRPLDAGAADSTPDDVSPPINLVQTSKHTQTSAKSSAQSTIKSRSLESQQNNNPATAPAVTALVLPRSLAAVTTATHSVAIPLPSPPTPGPSEEEEAGRDVERTEVSETVVRKTSDRKRKHS